MTLGIFSTEVTVKQSRNRPDVAQRVPGGLGSQISWHSAREDGEASLVHRPPLTPGMFLVPIFTRGWVHPRAMVRSEGNMSPKIPVTQPGIDPGTVRLVAQRLNHYTTPSPFSTDLWKIIKYPISWKSTQWEPSCSVRTGRGQTDRQKGRHDEANSRFS